MYGHLVIADISGYTRFLTDSELEHANGIIGDLLNAVIASIQVPLRVSRIEGDAVFMYGVAPENMSGQAMLESVEGLYVAFAGALETMTLNTTCRCNACAAIGSLGLKIVMHAGEFAKATIGGQETLSGSDVVVAHRLLKNHVREETGIDDYLLVTEACADHLGLQEIVAGWSVHAEEYEDVGEVTGYVTSLADAWAAVRRRTKNKVPEEDAWLTFRATSKAPPSVVWDHFLDPVKRTQWLDAHEHQVMGAVDGKVAPGIEYHCAHGDNELLVFIVLDMKTADYMTIMMPLGDSIALRYTDYIVPDGEGTEIMCFAAKAFNTDTGETLPDEMLLEIAEELAGYQGAIERLAELAEEAAAQLARS